MYGLVNRSIAHWVTQEFGESTWASIRSKAEPLPIFFSTFENYSDDITFRIVQAASEQLNLPVETVLERLGEGWIPYAESEGMGDILSILGRNVFGCLQRMDELHERVRLMMPDLSPPAFRCEILDERRALVKYWSHRKGMGPFVVGLLHGLGGWCGQKVKVEEVSKRTTISDCDTYQITLLGN
jgi:hypothetical protein